MQCGTIYIIISLILAVKFGKPWHDPGSYPAIRGTMYLNSVTFANFGNECGGRNVAIRTNPAYEDMQMPIIATNISYINVEMSHQVFYDNPSLGKVNPADCVDMPCDAKKKTLIIDNDGTLSGYFILLSTSMVKFVELLSGAVEIQ